ncbi:EKC/KEOPS complex subunit GON7 isoform X1 [Rhinolophus sinicus]|uniref:EKC/KEOPS complex subunit GON7 isoform X1 n=1 Tax=Rhinolophus sinicus TaxID=89399 RepID=UPI003D7A2550
MELLGEYVGPEGQRRQLEVPCESPGDADPFQSLLSGVAQMRELVAEHFGPLVQREAQDRVAAAPDEALDERAERVLLCARHWAELWRKNEVNVSQLLSLWNSDWCGVRQANTLIKKSGSVTPGPSVPIVNRENPGRLQRVMPREGMTFELGAEG